MNEKKILNAIGDIDNSFIKEAEIMTRPKKSIWLKWGTVAACFALALILGVGGAFGGWFNAKPDVAKLSDGSTINFVKSDLGADSFNMDVKWKETRDLTEEELAILFPDLSATGWGYFDNEGNILDFSANINGIKTVVGIGEPFPMDAIIVGDESVSDVNGVSVKAGYFITHANSKGIKTAIYYASFDLGDCKIYIENSGDEADKESVKTDLVNLMQQLIENGEPQYKKIVK